MKNKETDPGQEPAGAEISRRTLVAGAVAATAGGAGQAVRAGPPEKSELEIANETLVNHFCRDWSLRDVDKLRPYLAEDLFHQQAPGRPMIESRAQFEAQMGDWLKTLKSVHFEILRSYVIGPVVLNERIDHFVAPEGGSGPSMRFHVVGEFFVEAGVIKVWKDWPMPGSRAVIG